MTMRKLQAHLMHQRGHLNKAFSKCIGVGRAGELMRAPVMKQLLQILQDCPFEYIRFHGIFHEEMNVVRRDENGNLKFCFFYTDMLFDMLLENNIRPVCELGLMPDIMASEQKYVFRWKMNISMPKEISEWEMLIDAFVRHLTERYGEEEIKKWYFEVWNEPNHHGFFTENKSPDAYFKLYEAAARTIKSICTEYKVGGPASAGMVWVDETITHCRKNNIPIDFITSHSYGAKGDFDPEGNAITVIKNVDKVSGEIRVYGEKCRKENLPFIITEWSSSYSPTDPVHDHYFSAPYLLRTLKRSEGFADMLSYWVFTDIFEENSPPTEPFHGGFGLMTVHSVPKPVYHAYSFLSCLGETELDGGDENSYICKSENGVQVLFWNISTQQERIDNKKYFIGEIPCESVGHTQIVLDGFEAGKKYTVIHRVIGKNSGDPLSLYKTGKYGKLTTREQVAMLIKDSKPREKVFRDTANSSGTLEFTFEQHENQVDLLEIAL